MADTYQRKYPRPERLVTLAVRSMQPEDLRRLLEAGAPVTVLDLRTASDRAEWWIPQSIHIPAYESLQQGDSKVLDDLDLPPALPVVAVCRAGVVAQAAARHLAARGLNASYLVGGMRGWSGAWNLAEVPVESPEFAITQVRRTGKGCLSYLVGSETDAAVIDPAVDPEIYHLLAQQRGWRITAVLDTHIHADHISRSRELAHRTGAQLFLPAQDRAAYGHLPLHDGDRVSVGRGTITVLATPGHTPESACFQLGETVLFTGDTLFLGAVGRPDLEATDDQAVLRARLLHSSLRRITAFSGATLILPGHTGRPVPFDRRPIAATLETLRKSCEALEQWFAGSEPSDAGAFAEWVLGRLPPPPPNHREIVRLNETGAAPADPEALEAGANHCAVS